MPAAAAQPPNHRASSSETPHLRLVIQMDEGWSRRFVAHKYGELTAAGVPRILVEYNYGAQYGELTAIVVPLFFMNPINLGSRDGS